MVIRFILRMPHPEVNYDQNLVRPQVTEYVTPAMPE